MGDHDDEPHLGACKTSMPQDAEAGRPFEIDAPVTAVTEIGGMIGVYSEAHHG